MRRYSFGYIVDHPNRDLPGAISFARAASRRGCDTYIVPFYEQAIDVPLLPLDALIINFARPANFQLVESFANSGLPVFVMDTEGGTITEAGTNTADRLAKLLNERGFANHLSGYFFWGSRLRDAFVAYSGLPAEKLVVTGCPRFDYASSRFRAALEHKQSNYVLINTSYPLVNPRFAVSEGRERAAAVAVGWDDDYLKLLGEDIQEAFRGFKAVISRLAADLPQLDFLVRPHPFENPEPYRQELGHLRNVTIDGSGAVLNVIAHARCVLHLNCQTAVESIMLDRLPISLEFLNTPRMLGHAPLPSRISQHASSYEELIDLVKDADRHTNAFPFTAKYNDYIQPWFHENDGLAGERIVEHLLQHVTHRTNPISIRQSIHGSRRQSTLLQRVQSVVSNVFGSYLVSRFRSSTKSVRGAKAIGVKEVSARVDQLCAVDGSLAPRIERARHPITGLPLSTIATRAADPT
jgi:surface carbohydrate biosynthesis protein